MQSSSDDFRVCRLRRQKFLLFWGLYTRGNAPKARENFAFYALYKRQNRPKFAKILADSEFQQTPPWFHQILVLRGGGLLYRTPLIDKNHRLQYK